MAGAIPVQVEDQGRVSGVGQHADPGIARVDVQSAGEVPNEVEHAFEVRLTDRS